MFVAYHEIVPEPAPYIYSVDSSLFAAHLTWFAANYGEWSGPPRITFDDGHASQYRYALSLLGDAGLRATFFVTAGWTGVRPEYMTWSELRELTTSGHSVQSHGWSHRFLTSCSDHDLRDELTRSKATLEDWLGVRVNSISMPGGRCNARVANACVAAGYDLVYTSNPWANKKKDGVSQTGRFMVRNTTDVQRLIRYVAARRNPAAPERVLYDLKSMMQRLAGDTLYQHMWRMLGHKRSTQQIDAQYRCRPVRETTEP